MITRKTQNGTILLILLTALSFWITYSQDQDSPAPVAGLDPKLDYVLRDFELQFFDENGLPTINLRAPILRNDPEIELGTIEKPVVKLNQADLVWHLTADMATVTADKEYVHLLGQVHVERQESLSGYQVKLDTRDVQIEVTPQTAQSDQAVHMTDGRNHVNAIGLGLDLKANTFSLKHQVKATYAVN